MVELAGRRAIIETANGLRRDAERIDLGEFDAQRFTALTILLTSTGSLEPLRFFTRIDVWGIASSEVEERVVRNGAAPLLFVVWVVSLSIGFLRSRCVVKPLRSTPARESDPREWTHAESSD